MTTPDRDPRPAEIRSYAVFVVGCCGCARPVRDAHAWQAGAAPPAQEDLARCTSAIGVVQPVHLRSLLAVAAIGAAAAAFVLERRSA